MEVYKSVEDQPIIDYYIENKNAINDLLFKDNINSKINLLIVVDGKKTINTLLLKDFKEKVFDELIIERQNKFTFEELCLLEQGLSNVRLDFNKSITSNLLNKIARLRLETYYANKT